MELHEIRSDDDAKTYSAERKARCKYYKPLLEARVIYWFEHHSTKPPTLLGLLLADNGSCIVIGGLTGSHSGGHGEQGWQKLKLVLSSGYIPIQGEADWSPPPLSERDARRVLHIQTTGEIGYI
jgi:hypothetical protein